MNPGNLSFRTRGVLRNLELVERMGHLFAMIPTRLDVFLYHSNGCRKNVWENLHMIGSKYMPLQFFVIQFFCFQLEGDHIGVEGHGVIRSCASRFHSTSILHAANRYLRRRRYPNKTNKDTRFGFTKLVLVLSEGEASFGSPWKITLYNVLSGPRGSTWLRWFRGTVLRMSRHGESHSGPASTWVLNEARGKYMFRISCIVQINLL